VGRIVVTQYLSLDGVMEAPGPRDVEDFRYKAWLFDFDRGPEGDRFKREEMLDAESLLFGRVTYETLAAVWPGMTGAPGLAGGDGRQLPGDILVHGSRRLVQAMFEDDLVDELRQMIYPLILGRRKQVVRPDEREAYGAGHG
jgi:dihydrofolate reductase